MNVLQNVNAIARSPEAAALVASGVQASDLAARQGQASIQRDAARQQDQVLAAEAGGPAEGVQRRRERPEQRPAPHRQPDPAPSGGPKAPYPYPRHRLDILA